jgi:tRNA splicing endonuclease
VLINPDTVKPLRFFLFLFERDVPNLEDKGVVSNVYEELYEKLMEEYNLPSKVAQNRYWVPSQYTRVGIIIREGFRFPRGLLEHL